MTEAGPGASGFGNWGWLWSVFLAAIAAIVASTLWSFLLKSRGIVIVDYAKGFWFPSNLPLWLCILNIVLSPSFVSGFVFAAFQVRAWKQIPLGMVPWALYILLCLVKMSIYRGDITAWIFLIPLYLTFFVSAISGSFFGWLSWKLFRHFL